MKEEKHVDCITHAESDVDFNIYYNFEGDEDSVEITGIYLIHSNVDLIDVIDSNVLDDLTNDIIYEVEGL